MASDTVEPSMTDHTTPTRTSDDDAATRAHRIVEEVLAAAAARDGGPAGDDRRAAPPAAAPGSPAAIASAIVAEVLDEQQRREQLQREAEQAAGPKDDVTTGSLAIGGDGAAAPVLDPPHGRFLAMLGQDEPLVLLPGPVFEPDGEAYTPPPVDPTVARVHAALQPTKDATAQTEPHATADEWQGAPEPRVKEPLDTSGHPFRWALAAALWAAVVAGFGPLMLRALAGSVDFRIDIWG